jgi:hypothetical protein
MGTGLASCPSAAQVFDGSVARSGLVSAPLLAASGWLGLSCSVGALLSLTGVLWLRLSNGFTIGLYSILAPDWGLDLVSGPISVKSDLEGVLGHQGTVWEVPCCRGMFLIVLGHCLFECISRGSIDLTSFV